MASVAILASAIGFCQEPIEIRMMAGPGYGIPPKEATTTTAQIRRAVFEEFHRRIPDYDLAPGVQPRVVWPSGTLHLGDLSLVFPKGGGA